MFGIIASEEYADDIRRSLQGESIIFERIGTFSEEQFAAHCSAAAGVMIDTMIIDLTSCAAEFEMVRAIRKYRIARSNRVILLAPGREPGDAFITALVNAGVYDIVAPALPEADDDEDEETFELDVEPYIRQQLRMSYHIGNAARWMDLSEDQPAAPSGKVKDPSKKKVKAKAELKDEDEEEDEGERQPKPKKKRLLRFDIADPLEEDDIFSLPIQKKVVYQDRIVGSVYVGVAGTGRRTGSTYAALQVAKYLTSYGTVAIVELQQESLSLLSYSPPDQTAGGGFELEGIACFPKASDEILHRVLMGDFKYVVLDFGALLESEYAREFARCHVHLLTMGAAIWDQDKAVHCIDELLDKGWSKKLEILVNFATKGTYQQIANAYSNREKTMLNLQFHHQPLVDHPLVFDGSTFERMLGDALPKKRKKSFWRRETE